MLRQAVGALGSTGQLIAFSNGSGLIGATPQTAWQRTSAAAALSILGRSHPYATQQGQDKGENSQQEQQGDQATSGGAACTSKTQHTKCYEGFFAANHKRLKVASLVNTAVSLGACPAIIYLSDASPVARALVAASVVGFGLGTTVGLHWFTSPYVHELQWAGGVSGDGDPGGRRLRAKTLTLLGGSRWTEFDLSEVTHPDSLRPLATFKVRGRFFYVDRGALEDEELLSALTPQHPMAAELEQQQQILEEEEKGEEEEEEEEAEQQQDQGQQQSQGAQQR